MYAVPVPKSGSSKPRSFSFNLKQASIPRNNVFFHLKTQVVSTTNNERIFGRTTCRQEMQWYSSHVEDRRDMKLPYFHQATRQLVSSGAQRRPV